ncbi:type VII toxin-antitoxin system HepT family RNase toxin [Marinomonas sp.]|uniref:type VII toxin-antitoxin system HepT family RNase toxin n=1 Tax=Marinomonas sp. TaxID=1904862 RepID=UPI003BACF2D4
MNDSIINKLATIDRCLDRIRDVYSLSKDQFDTDYTSQDSIILNLQRACEASIDAANILNKQHQTGIPQSSRDSFELLKKARILSAPLTLNLQKMVGLRNIAVHDYQTLNLDIVKHIVEHRLGDFEDFIAEIKML